MGSGAKVKIGDGTYTAGSDDATLVADKAGVEITKGSVTISNGNGEVEIKGVTVGGKSGTVTVSATNNGSSVTGGTVTISDGGSAVIAGKTVTGNDGGTAISIDTDGKAILNVASDKSATVNGATLTGTGDGGSAFTLGTDGITVPAGAAVTASDGKTAIVSVAKDTKVEVGTDGGLTLVEGKGTVKGAEENDSSISVKIDGETVNVTVPAGKSYTIDADKGTLGTLAKDETVIIGGVTYTAGSENAGFSIKDVSLNTGDKAEIPANTNADIKLGSGDNAPEATVPGGNTGKVTITKDTDDNGAEVTTITIEAENDSFIINGKTYTAESDKATYTVSKNGAVTLTSGKTSVSGNKQIKLNNSSYTAGDNGATVEVVEVGDNTAGKVTAGSVKVDKDQKIAVGNDETNTIIENKETGKIEVGSDGSVTVPANGEVSVGGNVYNIGDEETVLKVGNDGTVSVEQGTVTIPAGAAVKDENSAATITGIEGGTGTKVKVIDNRLVITEGKAEVTGNSENGSRVSVKVGNKVVDVIVPQDKTYTIDTVNSNVSGLAAGETVTIDGVTYTSVDGNNSFPLINGALTGNGASAAVPAGTSKTVKVGNVDVKVSSNNSGDTKVAKTDDGAQIELGKSGDKITVGGNVYEAESDGTKLDVDSDGKVTLKEGKITAPANAEIKVGDTTVSGSGNITVETKTEKTGTETETKKETVTVQKENSTVSIGNKTYTVSEKNTEIEITAAGNRLLAGGVSLDNDAEIIFGEKTVYSGSNVTLTVNTDGTAAAAVPNSGKITIGGKEYEAGSSGATLIVDREGNILIEEGTLKVSANSNITVGGNTYTAAAGGQGIEIKGRGKDQTPAIVLAQDSIAEVKLSDGRTATYTAANADTQFALAGNGSDVKNIELLDNGSSNANANSALNFTDKDSYKINGVTYTAGNTGGYTVTYGKDNENNCNKIDAAAGSDVTAVMDKDTKIKIGSVKNGNITLTGDITFTADNSKAAIVITKTGDTNTVSGSGSYLTEIKDNDGNITGYKVTKYYSGGGSVVAPVTPSETDTITADVTGDKTSVKITAKISEESATVAEIDKTDLDKAGTGADITIDLSVLPKEITSATVTKKSLENVCDSEAEKVSIKLTEATVNMDRGTLENIIDQMKGQDLKLVVDKHEEAIESMNEAQKNTVTEMNSPKLMDAYFISGGTRITDFRGGSVDIEVPYPDKKGVKAWYIDDNGNKEEVPVKYDGKTAVITVSHFSYYVLEEYTPDNAEPVTADTLNKVIYVKSIKYTKKTGTKITFNKVPGADGYYIYGNKCNTDKVYKFKKLATLEGNDNTVFVHKKTAKNTFYKYYIRAYKIVDGKKVTLSTSKEIHFVTDVKGYSYGNPTKIKLSVSKRTISKGKTFNLKNRVKVYSSKKVLLHTAKVRYVSSDSSIAKVNSSGKITAKKTGRCYVYAIAQNGIAARIAVTVK